MSCATRFRRCAQSRHASTNSRVRWQAKLQALEARAGSKSVEPHASEPSRLAVSGDVRLRFQGDYADTARDRESEQVRGRLGATYKVNETLTLGARLVTGDPDDPNSTDVQLSNFDDDLQFALDQAYVQFNLRDLKLYGGKIPQPFTRTDLVWDSDVNPQGVSAVYKRSLGNGSALRVNGLYFLVDEDAVAADSRMAGAQLGYDFTASDTLKFDLSLAYYDYTLGSVVGADAGDFRTNLRNPDGSYQSDFDLGDAIVGATWTGIGDRWPLRAVADYVHNFGAIELSGHGLQCGPLHGAGEPGARLARDVRLLGRGARVRTGGVLARQHRARDRLPAACAHIRLCADAENDGERHLVSLQTV